MKYTLKLCLLSFVFIGCGFILSTPTFENFDEYAHYSRIIESINHGFSIQQHSDRLDSRIENYHGPMPYGNGQPPFDTHLTYKKFFDEKNYNEFVQLYKNNAFVFTFESGKTFNWQYQHPPFYYFLMGIFLEPFESQSLHTQVLLLRFFSYAFVILSIWITFLALQDTLAKHKHNYIILFPALFPMFFIEFARIGNDSICLLICSLIFLLLNKLKSSASEYSALGISFLCAIGMLFKAFFLPIFIGIALYLLFKKPQSQQVYEKLIKLTIFSLPFLFITASWFLYNQRLNADLSLGSEFNELLSLELSTLIQNFSITETLRGMLVPIATFAWSGTWSLTRVPMLMQLVFLLPSLMIFLVIGQKIVKHQINGMELVSLILIIIFYLSLIAHVLISQAVSGLGTSGGWYIHILFPWIIYLFCRSCEYIKSYQWSGFVLHSLFWLLIINTLIAFWFHLNLYAGIAVKDDLKYFHFQEPYYGFMSIDTVLKNNMILSPIEVGLPLIFIGYLIIIGLYFRQKNSLLE